MRIVELKLAGWEAGPLRRASTEPTVVIGDGRSPDHELLDVRGALLLEDGRILVANGRPVALRIYDSLGGSVGHLGAEGAGPGEFRRLASVQRLTDGRVLVFDPSLRRATVLSVEGLPPESAVLAPRQSSANPLRLHVVLGRFSDGTYLAEGAEVEQAEGVVVPRSRVARMNAALDTASPLGEFPGTHVAFAPTGSGGLMFWDPMFGRRTHYLVDRDGFYVAHSATWEIRRYDTRGGLQRIVRAVGEPHRLSDSDYDTVLDSIARGHQGRTPLDRDRARQEISLYATLPAFAAVVLDTDRNLWVRPYPPPGQDRGDWIVVGPDGRFLTGVAIPPGARVLDAAHDRILVLQKVADGEEQVHLYRLNDEGG